MNSAGRFASAHARITPGEADGSEVVAAGEALRLRPKPRQVALPPDGLLGLSAKGEGLRNLSFGDFD